jgi:transcriptional regulator with XRE-family HTH domain
MTLIRVTGSQLHAARVLVGLSREEVTERAGLCRHSIRKWETSSDAIPGAMYSHLCRVGCMLQGDFQFSRQKLTDDSPLSGVYEFAEEVLAPERLVRTFGHSPRTV